MASLSPTYEQALTWLERMRALLEGSGVFTVEIQASLGQLGGLILTAAAGRMPSAPKAARQAPQPTLVQPKAAGTPRQWSVHARLEAMGYTEAVTRGQRIKLGQDLVQAYRERHGRGPRMQVSGQGESARHMALYNESDLPLIDEVIRRELGEPPARAAAEG